MTRKYLIEVRSMNYCEEYQAAGVASARFLIERDKVEDEGIRGLIDSLDDTISQASVTFRPMTDEEIVGWCEEMENRARAVDAIKGDSETVDIPLDRLTVDIPLDGAGT